MNTLPARALSKVFGGAVIARNAAFDRIDSLSVRIPFPVVSVGGIHCGGTGKTPMTRVVIRLLGARNIPCALLSRGYGRPTATTVIADPGEKVSWRDAGDEPAMLAAADPLWLGIGADRVRTARALASRVPSRTVFVLDDGFQHRRLRRDLDIVCMPPAVMGEGLLPAGMLREPLESLGRAHAVCLIEATRDQGDLDSGARALSRRFPQVPVFLLRRRLEAWVNLATGEESTVLPLTSPALVTGIARPERFVELIRELGVTPSRSAHFPDHHRFSRSDIESLPGIEVSGLVTTEKDAQRLVGLVPLPAMWYLRMDLAFVYPEHEKRFVGLLSDKLNLEKSPEKEE